MTRTRRSYFRYIPSVFAWVAFSLLIGVSYEGVLAGTEEAYKNIEVLSEVLHKIERNHVEDADPKALIYGAIKGMVGTLDPHSFFMGPDEYKELIMETKGSFTGVGVEITVRDNVLTVVSPIEGTPAFRAGIKAGDQIIKIDDKLTKDFTIMDAVKFIRGPKGTKVQLTIKRKDTEKPLDFTITRDVIPIKSVRSLSLPFDIGYVRIRNFQGNTSQELSQALKEIEDNKGLKGFILDLRNNPGGLFTQALSVADAFLDSGVIVSIKGRDEKEEKMYADKDVSLRGYPMIVMINEGSASASEIVAGALQDNKRALTLGTTTFGKGSVQTLFSLSDGSGLRLTTALYYTPSGRSIQASGITPDIEVAYIPPVEEPKVIGSLVIREEDLEGHIEQESGEPTEEDQGESLSDEGSRIQQLLEDDNQLNRAIQIIKSWDLFSTMGKQRPPQ
jgi:carboxyl-terminal processing protease